MGNLQLMILICLLSNEWTYYCNKSIDEESGPYTNNFTVECPYYKPFFCKSDNSCRRSQSDLPTGGILCSFYEKYSLEIYRPFYCLDLINSTCHISCNLPTNFRCPDGSCVSKSTECSSIDIPTFSCPEGRYMCPDGSCKKSFSLCTIVTCKAFIPIQCINGMCAENISQCLPISNGMCYDLTAYSGQCSILLCPYNRPYKCSYGECVSLPEDCQLYWTFEDFAYCSNPEYPIPCLEYTTTGDIKCRKYSEQCIFQSTDRIAISKNKTYIVESNKMAIDIPPIATPIACIYGDRASYKISVYHCVNFLALNYNQTRPTFGCNNYLKPFRCKDGNCSASEESCNIQINTTNLCKDGRAFEDNMTIADCKSYNGCPIDKPFQCPNDYCATSLAECAGKSNCPFTRPFRCGDGTCRNKAKSCKRTARSYKIIPFIANHRLQHEFPLVYDLESEGEPANTNYVSIYLGSITIPIVTQGIKSDGSSVPVLFSILPVESSRLVNIPMPIISTMLLYSMEIIQIGQDQSEPLMGVLSTVIEINAKDDEGNSMINLNQRIGIEVIADIPRGSNLSNDLCLGRVDTTTYSWYCETRLLSNVTKEATYISAYTTKSGIYAIIFSPLDKPTTTTNYVNCGWACLYPKELITVCAVLYLIMHFYGFAIWLTMLKIESFNEEREKTLKYQKMLLTGMPFEKIELNENDEAEDISIQEQLQVENNLLRSELQKQNSIMMTFQSKSNIN